MNLALYTVLWLSSHFIPMAAQAAAPEDVAQVEARDALERAARFQRGDQPRPAPLGFHGRFRVDVRQRDGSHLTAEIERYYTRDPERMVTTRVDTIVNTDSTVGYDRGQAWFRDNKSGKVIVYSDDPQTFDTDMEQLDFQLQLMPILLEASVLDALIPRLRSPRITGRSSVIDLEGVVHEVEIVSATAEDELFGPDPDGPPPLPDDPLPYLAIQLGIDVETGAPWWFRVETLEREVPLIFELRFGAHIATRDGLRVPANIKVYESGAADMGWTANLSVGLEEPGTSDGPDYAIFELDPPIDERVFQLPEG